VFSHPTRIGYIGLSDFAQFLRRILREAADSISEKCAANRPVLLICLAPDGSHGPQDSENNDDQPADLVEAVDGVTLTPKDS